MTLDEVVALSQWPSLGEGLNFEVLARGMRAPVLKA